MAVSECKTCGQMRAKSGERECPVCWLVRELAREHENGEHQARENASCIACTRARDPLPTPSRPKTRKVVQKPVQGRVGSHAACDHESTPKARAKCRKARANR